MVKAKCAAIGGGSSDWELMVTPSPPPSYIYKIKLIIRVRILYIALTISKILAAITNNYRGPHASVGYAVSYHQSHYYIHKFFELEISCNNNIILLAYIISNTHHIIM